MALSLTCSCGARFEVEDTLADQTVTCPECQQSLQAPSAAPAETVRRTNLLALLSAGTALVGAFTPLAGQLVAIVLGCLALRQIRRRPEKETGAGFALFGIVGGVVFGAVMLIPIRTGDLFGFAGWWRQKTLADQVKTGGSLEIVENQRGFSITRPSDKWAVSTTRDADDPAVKALASRTGDLLLVNVTRPVYLDVQAEANNFRPLREREQDLLGEWGMDPDLGFGVRGFGRFPAQPDSPFQPRIDRSTLQMRDLEVLNGQGRELEMDLTVANQRWHMLVRLYSTRGGKFYIVKVFAHRLKNFNALRGEINALLDSFKPGA
jgi:hypothetical protein